MDQTKPVPPLQHIFVSYARDDSEAVDAIISRLKKDGFHVWIDRQEITGGDLWREAIVEAVDKCYVFLLFLSPASVVSDNVRKEVDLAEDGKLRPVPILLAPVEVPAKLRYQLAGIQWIKYYSDPEAKYAELVKMLRRHKPKPTLSIRAVGLFLLGLNRFNFGAEKQARLLDSIANFSGTPGAEFEVSKPIDLSGHIVVKMPADAAYRLKTAALNSDVRLIKNGIRALRLAGDRHFVFVKSGSFALLKLGNLGSGWFIVGSALVIALVMSLISFSHALPPSPTPTTNTSAVTIALTSTLPRTPTIDTKEIINPSSVTSNPIFILDVPSNCREGPGRAFARSVNATLIVGEKVEILGRNVQNTWYYVHWPHEDVKCWVSNELGHLENVPIIEIPTFTPVPTNLPPPTIPPTVPPTAPNSGI